ncbi:hypothetical protein HK104_005718, partial [Borealophlyctis nickersoniae]
LVYFSVVLGRFKIFQDVLKYNQYITPSLQVIFTILYLAGLTGDYAGTLVDGPGRIYFVLMSSVFWIALAVADIWISVLMVRTFTRVSAELERALHSSATTKPETGEKSTVVSVNSGDTTTNGSSQAKEESPAVAVTSKASREQVVVKLKRTLIIMVLFDVLAILTLLVGTAVAPVYITECSQIAEAWSGFHTIFGLMFLTTFRELLEFPLNC